MRFCGVDPTTLHKAISIAKEIPPGMVKRNIYRLRANQGDMVGGVEEESDEYIVRVNIAGHDAREAWEVRAILAGWACAGNGQAQRLEPTNMPGTYYDAICSRIEPPEFKPRFAVVEVAFLLPSGEMLGMTERERSGTQEGTSIRIGGTRRAHMRLLLTMSAGASALSIAMDGKEIAGVTGSVKAGDEIEIDFSAGTLMINGAHAESRIDVLKTRWGTAFLPGVHTITASAGASIKARWREAWT